MRRKALLISTLLCGVALVCGCRAPEALAPADGRNATAHDAVAGDAAVLQIVFDDMLSKDNDESPVEWHGDQSKPVYVSKNVCGGRLDASQIIRRHDEKKWEALTDAQLTAATEAANNMLARVDNGALLPDLKSTSGRLKIYEDAGAATQPTRENPFDGERASCVLLPGYCKDGRYAIVHLAFPWSGRMHSGEVTYILERTDRGWKVLLRDFIYYV
jgi:hypothetical protein